MWNDLAIYYEEFFPFRPQALNFLMDNLRSSQNSITLDIGCGTGSYTAGLNAEGIKTIGIDADNGMIKEAKLQHPDCPFAKLSMENIAKFAQKPDALFSIGNVVSHLTLAKFAEFIKDISTMLPVNGIWLFQIMNWDFIIKQQNYQFPTLTSHDKQAIFKRNYSDISLDSVQFNTELIHKDLTIKESATMTPLQVSDIIKVHQQNGFILTNHHGSYAGNQYDKNEDCSNIFIFKKVD